MLKVPSNIKNTVKLQKILSKTNTTYVLMIDRFFKSLKIISNDS